MAIRYRKQYGSWQVNWNNPYTGKRESKSFRNELEAKKEDSIIRRRLLYEQESFKPVEEEPEETIRTLDSV